MPRVPSIAQYCQSAHLEDRRDDVDRVMVLVTHFAAGLDPLWPRDDHRRARAARKLLAFTAGFDRVEAFATYVPYGEVILFVGRFRF